MALTGQNGKYFWGRGKENQMNLRKTQSNSIRNIFLLFSISVLGFIAYRVNLIFRYQKCFDRVSIGDSFSKVTGCFGKPTSDYKDSEGDWGGYFENAKKNNGETTRVLLFQSYPVPEITVIEMDLKGVTRKYMDESP